MVLKRLEERPAHVRGRNRAWCDLHLPVEHGVTTGHAYANRRAFELISNDDPSEEGWVHYTDVPVSRDEILAYYDAYVVRRVLVPGTCPLRAKHRMNEHDLVFAWQARLLSYKGNGRRTLPRAADPRWTENAPPEL